MKKLIKFLVFAMLGSCAMVSCGIDEPDEPEQVETPDTPDDPNTPDDPKPENNSSVVIYADGSTSTGVVFSPIDDTTFFLDYIKYAIVDSHLEIIGYDKVEMSEELKPFATVKYRGVTYKTRAIAQFVFSGCKKITAVTFPEGLQTIGRSAFYGCSGLTTVTFPEGLQKIGGSAFSGCSGLTTVTFSEGLREIGEYAFNECSGLTTVTFTEGLQTIGAYAFYGCSGLTTVTLPEGLQTIGIYAFYFCEKLINVTCLSTIPPKCYTNSWHNILGHMYMNLYVPKEAVETYKKKAPWSFFKNIQGI